MIGNQLMDQMASVDGSQGISAISFHKIKHSAKNKNLQRNLDTAYDIETTPHSKGYKHFTNILVEIYEGYLEVTSVYFKQLM
jgi:hypothetical protein